MMELTDTIVIIAIVIGIIALLFILFAVLICINRRRKNVKKNRRNPIVKKDSTQSENLIKDKTTCINMSEAKHINNEELNFNSDNYKFFGISFNEIPFIDDSKYNSIADLSWNPNPYKQLINDV